MTTNAIDEWINKAIPPGSGRYYAILHAPTDTQPRLRAITTLISIWSKLCFSNRELDVAQKKMQWWQDELNRTTHLHPVTCELQRLSNGAPIDDQFRLQLLDIHRGYGTLLTMGSPASESANREFHQLTGATALTTLCGQGANDQCAEQLAQAGILLSRLRCLRYLHMHVGNGLMCLPMADLESQDIKPNQFVPGNLPSNAKRYLTDTLQQLQQDIKLCMQSLASTSTTDDPKPAYIYLQLQQRLLAVMQKNTDELFQPTPYLAPLRNYWIALRSARQFDKAKLKTNA